MKKIAIILLAAVAAIHAVAEEKALTVTFTPAYNSKYMLYGYNNGEHLYHADLSLFYPLTESISVWGGSWYGQVEDGSYEEVDVYAGADYALGGPWSVGLGYSMFNYIETPFATNNAESEFAVHVTYTQERFSIALRNQYDTGAEGVLTRVIAGAKQPVTDTLTLEASLEAGYAFEYYTYGRTVWNHGLAEISLPIPLGGSFTLTPSISHTMPFAAMDDYSDEETVGAASVSYTF